MWLSYLEQFLHNFAKVFIEVLLVIFRDFNFVTQPHKLGHRDCILSERLDHQCLHLHEQCVVLLKD